jgi:hypothetical protein
MVLQRRMIVNYELVRIWRETVVTYLRNSTGICLVRLRKNMKNLSEDSHPSRWDSDRKQE